jgi:hypothetical protein
LLFVNSSSRKGLMMATKAESAARRVGSVQILHLCVPT